MLFLQSVCSSSIAFANENISDSSDLAETQVSSAFPKVEATAMTFSLGTESIENARYSGIPAALANSDLIFPQRSARAGDDDTGVSVGEEPEGDEAYISALEVYKITSGTAPWDSDDSAGNDSSADNSVLRSMDAATYDIKYVVTPHADAPHSYYKNGRLGFQVVLPTDDEEKLRFDVEALGWVDTTPGYETHVDICEIDGVKCQVLTCYRRILATETIPRSIPGSGTVQFVIDAGFMKNGDKVEPRFYAWVEGNSIGDPSSDFISRGDCVQHGFSEATELVPPALTISAAPRYDIEIRNPESAYVNANGDWDFTVGNEMAQNKDAGTVNGRLYGFVVNLSLKNADASKQLRGIEIPQGPIEFDLSVSSTLRRDGETNEIPMESNGNFRPLFYSVSEQANVNPKPNGRSVLLNGQGISYGTLGGPGNKRTTDTPSASAYHYCYDGGTWSASEQNEDGSIHITVTDYELDTSWFPCAFLGDSGTSSRVYKYGDGVKNVGYFSSGVVWIVQPYESIEDGASVLDEYSCTSAATFTVGLSDSKMKATSISGASLPDTDGTDNQMTTTNDVSRMALGMVRSGSVSQRIQYTYYGNVGCSESGTDKKAYTDNYSRGDDAAVVGSKLRIVSGSTIWQGETYGSPVVAEFLVKIDTNAIEIDYGDDNAQLPDVRYRGNIFSSSYSSIKNVYLAAKKDGTAWTSWEEQKTTEPQELVYYHSRDELEQAGAVCVGVLVESYGADTISSLRHDNLISFPIKVKANADLVGYAAPVVAHCRNWSRQQFLEETAALAGKEANATTLTQADFQNYIKTIWPDPTEDPALSTVPAPRYNCRESYSYNPAYYDANGYSGGHVGAYQYGDTLYLVGESVKITKTVAQQSGNAPKSVFDMDYTQRYSDYVLRPALDVGDADVSDGYSTTITITDTLPKELSYVPNSSYIGGTYQENNGGVKAGTVTGGKKADPLAIKNDDGTTTLTWTMQVDEEMLRSNSIPPVYYSCLIGTPGNEPTDVVNNQEITNSATIMSTYDRRRPTPEFGNISDETIRISKLLQSSLAVAADNMFYEVGDAVGFTSTTGNYGDNSIPNAFSIGIFPYPNDGRSDYSGTYELASMKIDPSRAGGNISDVRIFITTDAAYRDRDYKSLSYTELLDVSKWIELTVAPDGTCAFPAGTDLSKVVGWASLDALLEPDMSMSLSFSLAVSGNAPGDAYGVSWSDSDNIVEAASYVVGRSISGRVFLDTMDDGAYDEGEDELVSGAVVSLVADDGSILKDLNGAECRMECGGDGAYLFDDLPAGDFTVRFEPPTGESWDGYRMAKKDVATVDDANDSDADGVFAGDVLASAQITGIHMPSVAEMSNSSYALEHMDAGLVPPVGYVELTKGSALPDITSGNPNYSLEGAVYGIYRDEACTQEVARLTTDESGRAVSSEIDSGPYFVKEIDPSPGYSLDDTVYPVTVIPRTTVAVNGGNALPEPPIVSPAFKGAKHDAENGASVPVGDAMLAGAEFTVEFYTEINPSAVPGSSDPERRWVLRADESGNVAFDDAHKVAGDGFYKDASGAVVFPMGTIVWTETKAPTGYSRNPLPVTFTVGTKSEVVVENEALRGGFSLQKRDAETHRDAPQGDADFEGVSFVVYNRSAHAVWAQGKKIEPGDIVMEFSLSADGSYASADDALEYGTYEVRETSGNEWYAHDPGWSQTISIRSEGEIAKIEEVGKSPENEVIRGGFELWKLDSDTASNKAQGDAGFSGVRIKVRNDSDRAVYVQGGEYASGAWCYEAELPANGRLKTAGDLLPAGTYTVKEQSGNDAYALNAAWSWIFRITADGQIARAVSTVDDANTAVADDVARGGFFVQKADADTERTQVQGDASFEGVVISVYNRSASSVVVEGKSYAPGEVVCKATLDAGGSYASDDDLLPYGTYEAKETAGNASYKANAAWSNTFSIRRDGQMVAIDGDASPRNEVVRGGVAVQKFPAETSDGTLGISGNGIFEDESNLRSTLAIGDALEATAPTASVGGEGIVECDGDSAVRVDGAMIGALFESASENAIEANDIGTTQETTEDARDALAVPQGGSSLESAEFSVVNRSSSSVVVDGREIAPGSTALTVSADGDGYASTSADALPYGTYEIRESKAPEGHLLNEAWSQTFQVRENGVIVAIDDAPETGSACAGADERVIRGDFRAVKVSDKTGEAMCGVPFLLVSLDTGESHVVVSGEDGRISTSAADHARNGGVNASDDALTWFADGTYAVDDAAIDAQSGVWFTGYGPFNDPDSELCFRVDPSEALGALPYGNYALFELDAHGNIGYSPIAMRFSVALDGEVIEGGTLADEWIDVAVATHADADESGVFGSLDEDAAVGGGEDEDGGAGSEGEQHIQPTLDQVRELVNEGDGFAFVRAGADGTDGDQTFDVYDVVDFGAGLRANAVHLLTAMLIDATTNEPVFDADGNTITATKEHAVSYEESENGGSDFVVFEGVPADIVAGKTVVVFEEISLEGSLVAWHKDASDEEQTVRFPMIDTVATDVGTGEHEGCACASAEAGAIVEISDALSYVSLRAGEEYAVEGRLVYADTGEEVPLAECTDNGRTSIRRFVPDADGGMLEMRFRVRAADVVGRDVVACEEIFFNGKSIACHADALDAAQTVSYPVLDTVASNAQDGGKKVAGTGNADISDTVSLSNLSKGARYRLVGWAEYADGAGVIAGMEETAIDLDADAIDDDGKAAAEMLFEAVDLSQDAGRRIVVCERLERDFGDGEWATVAMHDALDDEDQTLDVIAAASASDLIIDEPLSQPLSRTGVAGAGALACFALLSASAVVAVLAARRRRGASDSADGDRARR